MDTHITDLSLMRLLHLSSAALPVGAYAFSMGLEPAVSCGWLSTPEEVENWLMQQLEFSLCTTDLPVLMRLFDALENEDMHSVAYWNDYLLACRETRELQLSDTATGEALVRLLREIDNSAVPELHPVSFVTAFSSAAWRWKISRRAAAAGLLWSWMENQVIAVTKLMSVGQTRAQKMLVGLQVQCPALISRAETIADSQIAVSLPALALASSWHETQYSRLFRS